MSVCVCVCVCVCVMAAVFHTVTGRQPALKSIGIAIAPRHWSRTDTLRVWRRRHLPFLWLVRRVFAPFSRTPALCFRPFCFRSLAPSPVARRLYLTPRPRRRACRPRPRPPAPAWPAADWPRPQRPSARRPPCPLSAGGRTQVPWPRPRPSALHWHLAKTSHKGQLAAETRYAARLRKYSSIPRRIARFFRCFFFTVPRNRGFFLFVCVCVSLAFPNCTFMDSSVASKTNRPTKATKTNLQVQLDTPWQLEAQQWLPFK